MIRYLESGRMNDRVPKSNLEWKLWGKRDPLWGVASWAGKDRQGTDPWTDEEFYKLGETDWQDFLSHWRKYGVDNKSCLEIGCGAGRITMHLAENFQATFTVDVSEGMIAYASQRIKNPLVRFFLVDGTKLPKEDNSVTAVFSAHVFQHFDSLSYASKCFAEISRVLKQGGSMMVHLPIYQWHPEMPRIFLTLYKVRKRYEAVNAWVRRRLMQQGLSKPIMRSLSYPIDFLFDTLPEYGFTDIEISIFPVKSNNSIHPFVFARKR
jgi:SAM-dependent methyltransferase